ncbi:TetR family transcriptional regulator [Actinokineospora enzanensis]|uniref:TetR family transcriptional regulator n=1 Tax=Actinokineospora enzanensis TaxID=155975 RepID=UPI000363897B|nr:TetR family transcriptional regulator [Actinokineospora enzanensis]
MGYDSNATRERILAAATAEFAAHGIAGARVDRIAADARANKRAIYDYFGDKDRLFGAVLERQMTRCAEEVTIEGGDLAGYAERLVDYHAANPETLRLLMWEALEYGERAVPGEPERAEKYQKRVDAAAAANPPVDPRVLVFFTLGLVNWGFAVPQLRRMVLGADYPPHALREAVAEAVRVLAKYSPPRPDPV